MGLPRTCKPLIGVVHLPPLPGSPGYKRRPFPMPHGERYDIDRITEYAVGEAAKYAEAGFDAIIIENYGDTPYKVEVGRAEAAALAAIVSEVRRRVRITVGVNVLRNDAYTALAVAHVAGAGFVRVNSLCEPRFSSEGFLAPAAREAARAAMELNIMDDLVQGRISVLADVDVKHSTPAGAPLSLREVALECASRAGIPVWGIIVSGPRTGEPPAEERVREAREAADAARLALVIGSGIRAENVAKYWRYADAFIVGTSVKLGGITENMVSVEQARKLAEIVARYREVWPCTPGRG